MEQITGESKTKPELYVEKYINIICHDMYNGIQKWPVYF